VNTVDDLRHTLSTHTSLAPTSTGMVAVAQAGARRIRRRRRVATVVAAAVMALRVAVGVPLAARHRALPAMPSPARSAAEMTIDLLPGSGFVVRSRATDGPAQRLSIAPGSFAIPPDVVAYDPGAFDDAALPPGETVRVGGHDALLVPALSREQAAALKSKDALLHQVERAVVWRDPSGSWLTVSSTESRAELLGLAGAVRVGPARVMAGPLGLSRLPSGLQIAAASTTTYPSASAHLTVAGEARIEISVDGRSQLRPTASAFTIAGQPAWYENDELLIKGESCGIRVHVDDPAKITHAALEKMMGRATYRSCTDPTDWTPIIS
jgi:hypothetical protein